MSERILKALMQLFAIIARVDEDNEDTAQSPNNSAKGRRVVEIFLRQELNTELVKEYLSLYDEYLQLHHGKNGKKDSKRKRTSLNSVKILRICSQINEELTQKQKIIVLIRILEFISSNRKITEQEAEFAITVAESFNVTTKENNQISSFVRDSLVRHSDHENILYINSEESTNFELAKHIRSVGMEGEIRILKIQSVNMYFFKYFGQSELYLNGQMITNDRHHILNQGSSMRSSKLKPIYYSDIISRFYNETSGEKVIFRAENIQYHFKGGKIGLHDLELEEESGKLIGIMGGSGAGKSTLLNVLNGNSKPSIGRVTINGYDIHSPNKETEGVIGYVSQDDLLIDELTVFQNLFFNAKLCFGNLTNKKIAKKVLSILNSIGLYETKDLRVGSPLDKTISGGQRKRLNIALELIREPSVLFVDEPTSGLSSRDSENIMDLLKELALKGKLIFVVIHQPSSDIFKMFDKLLILDQGGYPIYNDNPVNAVVYFKTLVNHVNSQESECGDCGNVNPEQIFNIIEAKVVDEYGNFTSQRKTSAEEWNQEYQQHLLASGEEKFIDKDKKSTIPESIFKIPNKIKQLRTYFIRDVLSKLTNKQYMIINMLEAPALAAILAFFVKFFDSEKSGGGYIFKESENLPQYLFISVVVSLFLGLTVSAEEIIKDQKILKRESFLNLSKGSYLFSKISIMFIISAVQSILFVLVGNFILEIQGMWFQYWIVLFSLSCFANVLGLNISASFNSAKVIYILIPILIIPQLLFSGIIVKFDNLNPLFASKESVPWVGNVMASRWAYEGMAVTQYTDNEYEKQFFEQKKMHSFSQFKTTYYLSEIGNRVDFISINKQDSDKIQEVNNAITVVKNELASEMSYFEGVLECQDCIESVSLEMTKPQSKVIKDFLKDARTYYNEMSNRYSHELDSISEYIGKQRLSELKNDYANRALEIFVTNGNDFDKIVEADGKLIQKIDPIYNIPDEDTGIFGAHFYAPRKFFFGKEMSTLSVNIIVIWGMTLILVITLFMNLLKRMLDGIERLAGKMKKSKSN
jgi:ABC-type multidrug transport system ATPase subunit